MDVERNDARASAIAAAIGVPARARMLYGLLDGRARTSTELALMAGITPSTASIHLKRLARQRLVTVRAQGKHRFFSLEGPAVAAALETLSVLAGSRAAGHRKKPESPLRTARSCYDHLAGRLGVSLHDRLQSLGWLAGAGDQSYQLTALGEKGFIALGADLESARAARRHFALACLDWSERRPHLAGALGAALLGLALKRRWVEREIDSRVLNLTSLGRREMDTRLGLSTRGWEEPPA